MRNIRTGMMAHQGIADSIAAERAMAAEARQDKLTEAYLKATEPRAYASVALGPYGGRIDFYARARPVSVTCVRFEPRRFRFARIAFKYDI